MTPGQANSNKNPVLLFYVAFAATYALVAVGAFLPHGRVWGFNHLAYYAPAIRIIVLVVAAAAIVPSVSTALCRAAMRVANAIAKGPVWYAIAVSFLAFSFFFALRADTQLFGDGQAMKFS